MSGNITSFGLQCISILLEVGLVIAAVCCRHRRRYVSVAFYVALLLASELVRVCTWRTYGSSSPQYFYAYWTTDFLLVVGAFILVCFFFQRALAHEEKMWGFVRLLLFFVFILVIGISCLSFSRNYNHLVTTFVIEFNQNLYFTCLVLNTLLYILLQQINSADDELGLLVCGVGIQFAGPTATWALLTLTTGQDFARSLMTYMMPFCTMGMLLVWGYTIGRVKDKQTETGIAPHGAPVLAEATVDVQG